MTDRQWNGTIRVSGELYDDEWDAFLSSHPHGHHIQTAGWARVKAATGWEVIRIVAEESDSIVGGAQIIYRPLRPLGNIGYIPMGPVLGTDHSDLVEEILSVIKRVTRELKVRMVVIQEPSEALRKSPSLQHAEAIGVVGQVAPRATVMIDVTKDPETIRAEMKSRTRYNTKVGARKGVEVSVGTEADLPAYHSLLERTANRQGFEPYPLSYFEEMWRAFDPMDAIRLTLATVDGEPVAGQIAIPFGDTVVNKLSVWSGDFGSRRPNDAIQWDAICWAHQEGFHWYDLEGIRPEAAVAALEGRDPAKATNDSVTSFKLGYGGSVVLRPEPFVIFTSSLLRTGFRHLYSRVAERKSFKKMIKRLRVASPSRDDDSASSG